MHRNEATTAPSSEPELGDAGDDPDLRTKGRQDDNHRLEQFEEPHFGAPKPSWRHYFEVHLAFPKVHTRSRSRSRVKITGILCTAKKLLGISWLSILLLFVPLGIAVHVAGVRNETIVFVLNAIAIIPLTDLLTHATENVAQKLGVGLGALLNITFGNLVELVIFLMLREGHLTLVLSTLLGSMLVNMLFILGIAIAAGGWKFPQQKYNPQATQALVLFMVLGTFSILSTTILRACLHSGEETDAITLSLSRAISVLLIVVYLASLGLQIRTEMSEDDPEMSPISDDDDLTKPFMEQETDGPESEHLIGHAKIGRTFRDESLPEWVRMSVSVGMLILTAGVVSLCADYMVSAIEHILANAPLTKAFLGLVILPLLGNAAELGTALTVAMRNEIDLAVNVAVGSAIQIALFMAPSIILIAWVADTSLALMFNAFEAVALLAAVFMMGGILFSGTSHYLAGVLLCACFAAVGIVAFFYREQD